MNKQLIFIEEKYYSVEELNKNLNNQDLVILNKRGIITGINQGYKFIFVGVISIRNIAFTVLPKTLQKDSNLKASLTIKTLKTYSNNNSQLFDGIDYFNVDPDHSECSELAIAEFLINDFQENGLCRFEEDLHKINGEGDINWSETINFIHPIYSRNKPIYDDTINQITIDDQNHLTLALHKWSLGYVSKKYSEYLASDLFRLAFHYEENLNEIGNVVQLINHLQRQLSLIYSDREIRLIKSLIYLLKKKAGSIENDLSLYGTKKYENVWESICKLIVNDNYQAGQYFSNPTWNILNKDYKSGGTLIPDITCQDPKTGNFYLFDAKYYSIKYKGAFSGEPGYKDILKQFQYQIHIEKKIGKNISNAFLFPASDNDFQSIKNNIETLSFNNFMAVIGSVQYELFEDKKIWIIMCPFSKWQSDYINNKVIEYSKIFWEA